MVDTLAFLSKDYSEEEIHEIVDKVDTYVRFFGGDYAYLLKTNENTVYYGYIEDFEVPKEVVLEKISPEYRDLYEKYYQAEKEDNVFI